MKKDNDKIVDKILDNYKLASDKRDEFIDIIEPIYVHKEFQRRFSKEFLHHGNITLGEHIVEDAVVTYIRSLKYLKKHCNTDYDLKIAVTIAMLHDLYTLPWQNNVEAKTHKFFNAHGFRHPIEAVINSFMWYPELFNDINETKKIIDGIAHHMFPFPVVQYKLSEKNLLELKNYDYLDKIPLYIKELLATSTARFKVGRLSLAACYYKEGRIMANSDLMVSMKQIKDLSSAWALVSGKNKKLLKK